MNGAERLRPLVVQLPNTEYGLAVDENGARSWGITATVHDRAERVQMVAQSSDGDAALVSLTHRECRELGAWLLSAAVRLDMMASDAACAASGIDVVHHINKSGACRVSLNGQGHMPCPHHGREPVS